MHRTHIDDRGAILVEEKTPLRAPHVLIEFSVERHRFGLDTKSCYASTADYGNDHYLRRGTGGVISIARQADATFTDGEADAVTI